MKIRGISILTRKMIITQRFGAEAWAQLYRDVAGAHTCFRSFLTPGSFIPLSAYLAFHDELVRRFYTEDESGHTALGRESARWALTDGPCKAFMTRRESNLGEFVGSFPALWRTYFADTASSSEAAITDDGVEFKAVGLPEWHPYLEHFIVGYMTEMLEMFCANPIRAMRLRGGAGSAYRYLLQPATAASVRRVADDGHAGPPNAASGLRAALSSREMEVLRLVADSKTNDEIGSALGISGKTAQHHVARAYRKIGVSSRVSATVWLAQRGFLDA